MYTYLTIDEPSQGIYKEKGSKFLSFAIPVTNETEIKLHIDSLRKKYFDAKHHCYAYRIGIEKMEYRVNDDGEPSSSAGKPIFGQIQSNNLTNILIVVVRYFGGTLLGVGGLIQAYKNASADAIANAKIVERSIQCTYRLEFEYLQMNQVMKVIKDSALPNSDQEFGLNCTLNVVVSKQQEQHVLPKLEAIENLKIINLGEI